MLQTLHYTLCSVLFSFSMFSGTLLFIVSMSMLSTACLTKLFVVIMIISLVGIGMAKGRISSRCLSESCGRASSGMKVMPLPFSTMRMNVSMLPRLYVVLLVRASLRSQNFTSWSRKQCPSSSSHINSLLRSAVRMLFFLKQPVLARHVCNELLVEKCGRCKMFHVVQPYQYGRIYFGPCEGSLYFFGLHLYYL